MNITIYCGANAGDSPAYTKEAKKLGAWIGEHNHTLVWGAGAIGLMGAVAYGTLDAGGSAIGVIPDFIKELEPPPAEFYSGRFQLEITENLTSRRVRMMELGDVFVALPGGSGTLDELSEVIALMKFGIITEPLILMSVEGFYAPLAAQLDAMVEHGFMTPDARAKIFVAKDAAEVAELIETL